MARAGRSGQALGTSMYLCQQSVEKAFKSVLLRLEERAELETSEGDLRSLGHALYPKLLKLYMSNVSSIKLPWPSHEHGGLTGTADAAEQAAHLELECFKELSSSWGSKGNKDEMRLLAWQHSVGVQLDGRDLEALSSFHTPALKLIYKSFFKKAREPVPLANEERPLALRSRILERGLLRPDYDEYVKGRIYAPMHSALHGTYKLISNDIERMRVNVPGTSHVLCSDLARRAILEFGFRALALAAHPYHTLYPHSDLGRYPEEINGRFTDDVYGEQAEYVIKTVFLEGEYLVWGLCATSAHVEKLWRKGAEAGLW